MPCVTAAGSKPMQADNAVISIGRMRSAWYMAAKNRIFLIVDRGPAHIAKKTKAFIASLGGQLRLFYLPP
jgi:hypothetical protein